MKKIQLSAFDSVYFIGIGGIGMSALARYFASIGLQVGGYDKTPSPLTQTLAQEGISIHYTDLGSNLPVEFQSIEKTLVVFTPAIPSDMNELLYVKSAGYCCMKRAEALGLITRASKGLGVAGTHGKTTTSSMLAYILDQSSVKCNAFLGGISANFNTNFVADEHSPYTVIEADEFDRSFLQLSPFASIVTSTDADHLDIYGDSETFVRGFQEYANLIHPEGVLVLRNGLNLTANCNIIRYAVNENADFSATNLEIQHGRFYMDVHFHNTTWKAVELGLPGIHNAENALACIALCLFLGVSEFEIRTGLRTFLGVKRRFEYKVRTEKLVYIDDYAHHPTEISALVRSVRLMYPKLKITGIFQPHLFSRTQDFMNGFAAELSQLDEVFVLPIYPARELPIPGVTSESVLEKVTQTNKRVIDSSAVLEALKDHSEGVILTIGAGDIDRIVEPLAEMLRKNGELN